MTLIVIELLVIFGGVVAFGWWQLRDVARAQNQAKTGSTLKSADDGDGPN